MGFKWFRPKKGNSSKDNTDIPSSSGAKKSSSVSDPKKTDIPSSSGMKKSSPASEPKNTDILSSSDVQKSSAPCSSPKKTGTSSSSGVPKPSLVSYAKNGKAKKGNQNFAPKEKDRKPIVEIESQIFNFGQMERATDNFNTFNVLGDGGFGKVYRGRLEDEGPDVAIKRLENGLQGSRNFLNEIETLSRADHPNIVKLIGHCSEGAEMLVVYEYMPLGSLDTHLEFEVRTGLNWNTRVKIAAGVARALEYMRFKLDPPKIHRDIKPSNILLDDEYNSKLSDFGLAHLRPSWRLEVHPDDIEAMGPRGYMPPEYASQFTFKNDIYGFGVVLLEIFTGRKPLNRDTQDPYEKNTVQWARNVYDSRVGDSFLEKMADPQLKGRYPKKLLHQVLSIAVKCLREIPKERPSADELVLAFDYIERQKYEPPRQSALTSKGLATSLLSFTNTPVRRPKGKGPFSFPFPASPARPERLPELGAVLSSSARRFTT